MGRHQDNLAAVSAVFAHLLVARVQNQIGIRLFQPSPGKLLQSSSSVFTIRLTLDELKSCPHNSSAMLFTLRVDTPGTYISSIAATTAFAALITLEYLRAEPPLSVLRHSQFDFAHWCDQRSACTACSMMVCSQSLSSDSNWFSSPAVIRAFALSCLPLVIQESVHRIEEDHRRCIATVHLVLSHVRTSRDVSLFRPTSASAEMGLD